MPNQPTTAEQRQEAIIRHSRERSARRKSAEEFVAERARVVRPEEMELSGTICTDCGNLMRRTGACHTCPTCGNNTGCG